MILHVSQWDKEMGISLENEALSAWHNNYYCDVQEIRRLPEIWVWMKSYILIIQKKNLLVVMILIRLLLSFVFLVYH